MRVLCQTSKAELHHDPKVNLKTVVIRCCVSSSKAITSSGSSRSTSTSSRAPHLPAQWRGTKQPGMYPPSSLAVDKADLSSSSGRVRCVTSSKEGCEQGRLLMPQRGYKLRAGGLRQRQYRTMYAPCRPLQRPPVRRLVLQRLQDATGAGSSCRAGAPGRPAATAPLWQPSSLAQLLHACTCRPGQQSAHLMLSGQRQSRQPSSPSPWPQRRLLYAPHKCRLQGSGLRMQGIRWQHAGIVQPWHSVEEEVVFGLCVIRTRWSQKQPQVLHHCAKVHAQR